MSVEAVLAEKGRKTEEALRRYIAQWGEVPERLDEAIRYCLFSDGKRLRPALALGAAEILAGDDTVALPVACAVEMIHCYSLIHDDLPCMDDDDFRRGKPTAHRIFGEAMAILAGDGMLTMAFGVLAQSGNLEVIDEISAAAGVAGMAGGQALDLWAENRELDEAALEKIHRAKTGALIVASLRCGAILAGAEPEQLKALSEYGEHFGLAYQIADDILDVVGNEDSLGKPVGSDQAQGKSTYPVLLGLEGARDRAVQERDLAVKALALFDERAQFLVDLAEYAICRKR